MITTIKSQCYKIISVYSRLEGLNDPDGILNELDSYYANNPSFSVLGQILGLDYKLSENSYIKLEGRRLTVPNDDEIFYNGRNYTNNRYEAMLNMDISL